MRKPKVANITIFVGFVFDEDNTAPGLTLSEDKTKVSLNSGGSWLNARGLLPLSPDNPYCEFKIEYGSASQIMVGVVQGTHAPHPVFSSVLSLR